MNAARRAARAGRNLLIAILVGGVIIIAIVVAYIVGSPASAPSAGPSQTASSQGAALPGEEPEPVAAAPTGCLGGAFRDSAMVLRAQAVAPRSTYGAVEVATAFFRWGYRYPAPPSDEVDQIAPLFPSGTRAQAQQALRAGFEQNENPARGVVDDGTRFALSTVNGAWLAAPGADRSTVRVSVQAAMEIDGAISPTKTSSEAFSMRWESGKWRISEFAAADNAKLVAGGTAFTAGC